MNKPLISVVVPVYNGAGHIGACIASLLAMDYPQDNIEIIIVDNDSTDATPHIISQYPVVTLRESTPGSSAARNAGIRRARGTIIAFTDADCLVERQWAQEIEAVFQDPNVDAVQGFADGINTTLHAAFAQKRWEESRFYQTAAGYTLKHKGIDTRNCAFRTQVFERLGAFNPAMRYCGDLELSLRLNQAHYTIVFHPQMRVWHKNPASFREMREKSRKQLPFVLHMLHHVPEGLGEDDVPFPASGFYGIAQCQIPGVPLAVVLLLLRTVRFGVYVTTQLCLALGIQHGWALKLYKTFFGISYDIAILQAKWQRQ